MTIELKDKMELLYSDGTRRYVCQQFPNLWTLYDHAKRPVLQMATTKELQDYIRQGLYRLPDDRTQKELAADGAASAAKAKQQFNWGMGPKPGATFDPAGPGNIGDWLDSLTSEQRKSCPVSEGVLRYFADALAYVAYVSKVGNDKHNPGQHLHWSRGKSMDHADCIARHLATRGGRDPDSQVLHSGYAAWRALANLQIEIMNLHANKERVL